MRLRILAALSAVLLPASLFAATITGKVTNQTTGKPSAGDDVVLIKLSRGMEEATRAKSDAQGRYTLDLPDAGMHLVRVTHQGANYFQAAPPGTATADVDVYDVAAKVEGISGEADSMRIETTGSNLSVIESWFIQNTSKPARTQMSEHPFEFYLPDGAVIDNAAALGPGSMPVQASPIPLEGKGHYTFVFPLRPGETRFQLKYHLPYTGNLKFGPRPTMPTDTIAIVVPTTITFQGATANLYQQDSQVGPSAVAWVARNVTPSQSLAFTISGNGTLPTDLGQNQQPGAGPEAQGQGQGPQAGAAPADMRPGGGLGKPVEEGTQNDPWSKYKWWIVIGLIMFLAVGGGIMMQGQPKNATQTAANQPLPILAPALTPKQTTLAALKEELFSLETERMEGKLTEESYQQQKAALEVVLKRALERG